jgi:hypothetical protein
MKKFILLFGILLFTAFTYAQTNNVLLEAVTGTWCQYCPCGHTYVNTILTNRPNTLVLEYHGPTSSADPWVIFNGNDIISLFGFSSYPTAVVGRRSGIIDRTSWAGQVYSQGVNYPSPATLTYTKTYNSTTRVLSVTASGTALRNIDTATKINFVLYENNLIYSQTGNTGCPGGSNYVHNYVVRNMVNGSQGESFSTGTWASGTTKTATWNYTLPGTWVDTNVFIGLFAYFNTGSISSLQSYVLQTSKGGVTAPVTGVNNNPEAVGSYTLSQNYPNPFNPNTNIRFSIPKEGKVVLKIYDVLGNEVSTYFDTYLKSGIYNVEFDGAGLSSGVYFYKLIAGDFSETKRMILTK